jgi:tetratricopeptide (TPR) repeat protein
MGIIYGKLKQHQKALDAYQKATDINNLIAFSAISIIFIVV